VAKVKVLEKLKSQLQIKHLVSMKQIIKITCQNFRRALINDFKIKYNFERFMIKIQKLVEAGRALEEKMEIQN
jgi:hypothetical protein